RLAQAEREARRGGGGDHPARLSRSVILKKLLALLALVIVVAAAGAAVMYTRANDRYLGYTGTEQFVDIPQGAGSRAIGERLVAGGIIRDLWTYRVAVWMSGEGRRLKAGEYRFDHAMTPFEVIDKLARGDVYVINLTFPEGLTKIGRASCRERVEETEG